ncbi:29 kDa ribonucleoprotein A, chloroplastic [Cornus florida]|uniref:29 kDa ribonucleoprotein A, chloroplastic n=1 Tax=Cornus florida TaxID=4283 RepID=UPI0028A2B1FE|nr:29 kDa ribonucleoprotein A, chloroplastic [Cornus florida]
MSSSTSSLHFLSLCPKTLTLSNPKPATASLSLYSISSLRTTPPKSISISPSFLSSFTRPSESSPSLFVRNVAVSDFDQEEVFTGEVEPSFAPDLKLFVGNLPFSADSAALADLFGEAGTVEMVEVIYDKKTGRSRGFGFVTMSTAEEVEAAVERFNGYQFDGRSLRVNSGAPPPREESSFRGPRSGGSSFDNNNRLYVGNLSWGVDDLALQNLFSEQGKVVEARVVYDRDSGRSRGFGFVTYSSAEEVDRAIESFDGADLNGRAIRVSVAEARPKRF